MTATCAGKQKSRTPKPRQKSILISPRSHRSGAQAMELLPKHHSRLPLFHTVRRSDNCASGPNHLLQEVILHSHNHIRVHAGRDIRPSDPEYQAPSKQSAVLAHECPDLGCAAVDKCFCLYGHGPNGLELLGHSQNKRYLGMEIRSLLCYL